MDKNTLKHRSRSIDAVVLVIVVVVVVVMHLNRKPVL